MNGEAESAMATRLESTDLAVEIDHTHACITRISNRLTGATWSIHSLAFCLETSKGTLLPGDGEMTLVDRQADAVDFLWSVPGWSVAVRYQLESANANAVRKWIAVTNDQDEPVVLSRIVVFDWSLPQDWPDSYPHSYNPSGLLDMHLHHSGIWNHQPINLFLRDETGGLFMGMENPVFKADCRALRKVYPSEVTISYQPGWVLPPGETFSGDAGFVGVYRQEGIYHLAPNRVHFEGRERLPLEILD